MEGCWKFRGSEQNIDVKHIIQESLQPDLVNGPTKILVVASYLRRLKRAVFDHCTIVREYDWMVWVRKEYVRNIIRLIASLLKWRDESQLYLRRTGACPELRECDCPITAVSVASNRTLPSNDEVNPTPEEGLTNQSLLAASRLFPTLLPSADQPVAQCNLGVISNLIT